jgi:hypothetical protein
MSCGYRPAYGGERPGIRLYVDPAGQRVAQPAAVHQALAGVREELAHAGVLAPGRGYPRVIVEVVRVDERGTGTAPAAQDLPLARGTAVGVVIRAWVQSKPGGPAERDTGDVRRVSYVAAGVRANVDSNSYQQALQAASRRAGKAAGRLLMGEPVARIEEF